MTISKSTNMLNKSISSFDTMPSYDINFEEIHTDDATTFAGMAMVGRELDSAEYDEGYHVVLDTSEENYDYDAAGGTSAVDADVSTVYTYEDEDETGILILSPRNGSEQGSRKTELSVPDSVPSDLNSMLGFPHHVTVHGNLMASEDSKGDGDSMEPDLLEGVVGRDHPKLNARNSEGLAAKPSQRFILCISVLAVALSLATVVFVQGERKVLQKKTRQLQELKQVYEQNLGVIAMAKEQEEKTRLLEEQVFRLQNEALTREREYRNSQSSSAYDQWNPFEARKDDSTLLDNCWVHARAKMQLGECTREASKSMTKQVQSWTNFIGKAHERIWDQLYQDYKDMKDWISEQDPSSKPSQDKAKTDFWTGASSTASGATASSTAKATAHAKKSATDLKLVTKSFLTTAALGTAAAVLLNAVDWFRKEEE